MSARRPTPPRSVLGHEAVATLKMQCVVSGSWAHDRRENGHPHVAGTGLDEAAHRQLKAHKGLTSHHPKTVRPSCARAGQRRCCWRE